LNFFQGRFAVIKNCVSILDHTVILPNTICEPFSVYAGNPGRRIEDLPETAEEWLIKQSLDYYDHFQRKNKKAS
jgi:dynactin 5